jgi:putative transposase
MIKKAVTQKAISIRLASLVFGISETCYRYQAKLNAENVSISVEKLPCVSTNSGTQLTTHYLTVIYHLMVLHLHRYQVH